MSSNWGVALFLAAAMTSIGCSSSTQSVPGLRYDTFRVSELNRSSYSVLGNAEAMACRHSVALWPIPLWVVWGDEGVTFYGWIWNVDSDAEQKALANAPEADTVVDPREKVEDNDYFWIRKRCVTLRGKAIHLRTDAELSAPTQAR